MTKATIPKMRKVLLDVDETLIVGNEFNLELIEALKAYGINKVSLFSAMKLAGELTSDFGMPQRMQLIEYLKEQGIEVEEVIMSYEPFLDPQDPRTFPGGQWKIWQGLHTTTIERSNGLLVYIENMQRLNEIMGYLNQRENLGVRLEEQTDFINQIPRIEESCRLEVGVAGHSIKLKDLKPHLRKEEITLTEEERQSITEALVHYYEGQIGNLASDIDNYQGMLAVIRNNTKPAYDEMRGLKNQMMEKLLSFITLSNPEPLVSFLFIDDREDYVTEVVAAVKQEADKSELEVYSAINPYKNFAISAFQLKRDTNITISLEQALRKLEENEIEILKHKLSQVEELRPTIERLHHIQTAEDNKGIGLKVLVILDNLLQAALDNNNLPHQQASQKRDKLLSELEGLEDARWHSLIGELRTGSDFLMVPYQEQNIISSELNEAEETKTSSLSRGWTTLARAVRQIRSHGRGFW